MDWNQNVVDDRDYGKGWGEIIEWLKRDKGYDVVVINQHKVFGNNTENMGFTTNIILIE